MPYYLIPTILGTSFVLIWAFIGGMILSDGHQEVLRQQQSKHPLPRYKRMTRQPDLLHKPSWAGLWTTRRSA
jgi:hypothetical protein